MYYPMHVELAAWVSLCGQPSRKGEDQGTRSVKNGSPRVVRNKYLALENPAFLRSFMSLKFCCILIVFTHLHVLYFRCYLIEYFITNFQLFGPKCTIQFIIYLMHFQIVEVKMLHLLLIASLSLFSTFHLTISQTNWSLIGSMFIPFHNCKNFNSLSTSLLP